MLYVTLENNLTFPVYLFSVLTNANFQLSDGDNSLIQLHFTAAFLMNNLTLDTYYGKPPCRYATEAVSGHSKETGLVIYLAFLAKVANLYYILLAAFKKYWPDTVAKFTSGTQDRFI